MPVPHVRGSADLALGPAPVLGVVAMLAPGLDDRRSGPSADALPQRLCARLGPPVAASFLGHPVFLPM
jgi:hypothetical protein